MRYADFRDQLEAALRQEGLVVAGAGRRVETIDLADTVRRWEVHIYRLTGNDTTPFDVSAVISFDWSPVDAARAYTTEEDLVFNFGPDARLYGGWWKLGYRSTRGTR